MAKPKSTSTGNDATFTARTSRSIENSDPRVSVPPTQTTSHGAMSGTGTYLALQGETIEITEGHDTLFGGRIEPM